VDESNQLFEPKERPVTTFMETAIAPEVSTEPSSGSGISLSVRLRMMALMHRFNEIRLPSSKEEMQHKDL
jgi:hypothetical protein